MRRIAAIVLVLLVFGGSLHADTHYVSTNGLHITPFTNWVNAATNIQAAIDAAVDGDTVLLSNGIYVLASQISITNGITIQGANGAAYTTVDGDNSTRCFYLSHANALLEDLTITGGMAGNGGGVYCSGGGTVRICWIVRNQSTNHHDFFPSGEAGGGGIYLDHGGFVEGCVISNNAATNEGGGVFCYYGGEVRDCIIIRNYSGDDAGGACLGHGGLLENCLLVQNTACDNGGGLETLEGGEVVNCTIASNRSCLFEIHHGGGGLYHRLGGVFISCIIYGNFAGREDIDNWFVYSLSPNPFSYCCMTPHPGGTGNITNDPQLTPAFRLKSSSPCIDAGNMGAPESDIDGEARWDHPNHANVAWIVDIGADEFVDVDGDNMADYWEVQTLGSTDTGAAADQDSDGLNHLGEYEQATDPTNPDTDSDQMPDGWEVGYSLNPLADDASGDHDNDLFKNLSEYIAGTDPLNHGSFFGIEAPVIQNDSPLIEWRTVYDKGYWVQRSTNLVSWTNANASPVYEVGENPEGTESFLDTNAPTGVPLFYKILLDQP